MALLTEVAGARSVSASSSKPGSAKPFRAQAYGEHIQDLEVDFSRRPRPVVITQLLAACLLWAEGRTVTEEEVWDWTVAQRLQALLLVVLTTQGDHATVMARCTYSSCSQPVELDLDLSVFVQDHSEPTWEWVAPDDRRLLIRLPTGLDQRKWFAAFEEGDLPLPARMASRLVSRIDGQRPPMEWRVPDAWVEGIGAALEEHDPLTALRLDVQCPSCLHTFEVALDLSELLLRQLAQVQVALLDDIHRLATVYHWSEEQILAIPTWRRALYLKRFNPEALA